MSNNLVMSSKSKRLTITDKFEIIKELSEPNYESKPSLEKKFRVGEAAIHQIQNNRDNIRKWSAELTEDYTTKKSRI